MDYAATTPVDPDVADKIKKFFDYKIDNFGNPSSIHYFGQRAKSALDFSREKIAKAITANHREIIFTSSATEANNLILRGILKAYYKKYGGCKTMPKFIISSVEHPSILETAAALEKDGSVEVAYLPVDSHGIVDLAALKKELNERTILVSVMWVSNETGSIQPISEIVNLVQNFRRSKLQMANNKKNEKSEDYNLTAAYPLIHTDAVQAFNLFDLNVIKSGVDLMTLSSHKIYGPKGAGAAYIKGGADRADFIEPIITGGDQEYGLRSGTENVPAIAGFSKAAEISSSTYKSEFKRLQGLSERFFENLKKEMPEVEINGSMDRRSPNIINIYFPRHENLGITLDIVGVAASAGSACAQRYEKPSYVLSAMGYPQERVKQSIRFSFGRFSTEEEIDDASERIIKALKK